jgi:hypothetical protein
VQITAPASYTSASISVAAVSACGSSSNRTITVRSVPAQPGTISGTSTNLCGGGSFNYSIAAVTGATSYQWTPPTGCTITANSGTGITLSIPSNFTTGTLSVRAVNACGISTARTRSLTRLPATPSTITGATSVCYNAVNQGYAISSTPGLSYTWTVPTGATIVSGQGTNLITVNFGTTGGNITVKANNTCGSSTTRSLAVGVTACRMDENNLAVGREIELQLPVLYPNPGNGMLTISSFPNDLELQMRVFSASGQLVQESIIPAHAENWTLDLMHLASGLYLIRLESDSGIDELRYIKE